MKRLISILIALLLALPCAAFAEDSALTRVTKIVKEKLGIGDEYTEFTGESYQEGDRVIWNLSWNGDGYYLFVTCDDAGRIYSYDRGFPSGDHDFLLHYPALSREDAEQVAEDFIGRIMSDGEGAELYTYDAYLTGEDRYFNGYITLNGIPTDTSFFMALMMDEAGELYVTSFYRYDQYVMGYDRAPATEALVDEATAEQLLQDFTYLKLVYRILDGDEAVARPVYVRVNPDYFVDAVTEDVVEWSAGYGFRNQATEEAAYSMAADAGGLSAAELAGIEEYGETVTRDEADAMLRSIPILGLDGYEMEYFSLQKVGDEFCAYVRYSKDGEYYHAYTLNAVTGQLLMADTWYNAMVEPAEAGDPDVFLADAAAFLALAAPDVAEHFELSSATGYDGTEWTKGRMEYTFVRTENGIPFDRDTVSVTLDAKTGFVDTYRFNWTEDVSFEGEVAMDMDAALAAWLAPLSAELHYADWDNGEGTQRVLSWVLMGEEPDYILADSGEAVHVQADGGISYTSGPWHYSAARLADYGIGYTGGEVNADAPLTVRDMLTLAMGLRNPDYIAYASDESLLGGYYVRSLGYAEEDLNREATALELARVVVCTMEFGEAAKLPGIFRTGFTDEAEIPAEDLGYAAIASALRLVEADENGAANLSRILTRGEALDMLDRMLSR